MQRSIIEEDVHQASLANFTNSSFPLFFFWRKPSLRATSSSERKTSMCVNDHLCMRIILCNTDAKGQQGIIGAKFTVKTTAW